MGSSPALLLPVRCGRFLFCALLLCSCPKRCFWMSRDGILWIELRSTSLCRSSGATPACQMQEIDGRDIPYAAYVLPRKRSSPNTHPSTEATLLYLHLHTGPPKPASTKNPPLDSQYTAHSQSREPLIYLVATFSTGVESAGRV